MSEVLLALAFGFQDDMTTPATISIAPAAHTPLLMMIFHEIMVAWVAPAQRLQ